MTCTMTKDAEFLRSSLLALGYSEVVFQDAYGFITAIGVKAGDELRVVAGPLSVAHYSGYSDGERRDAGEANAKIGRDEWIDAVREAAPL